MAGKSKQSVKQEQRQQRVLERINLNAAGIDIGGEQHWVAVPDDRDDKPVQAFASHTADLYRLADWLRACEIETVAMESTGVYWIPLYEVLEARGFEVVLVNAHQVKHVPGRKTDVLDCQWLQELHTYGLLRGSFRPNGEIVALRTLIRHRETLVGEAATYIQRMQKALVLMNLQLSTVLTDISGKTGMAIIRDIVAGQTDPAVLAEHRDPRCKASQKEITQALTGHYREELVFVLRQDLACYDHFQLQIDVCDRQIAGYIQSLEAACDEPDEPLPPGPSTRRRANEPAFDVRSPLYRMTGGVDLTAIPGIGALAALILIAEIGTDMSKWPTAAQFAAWLTLAPQNKVSGGRRLSSRTQPSANRAAAILRMAAMSNARSDNALGAFYRRLALRIGTAKAITATARKLAVIVHTMLKDGQPYREQGADNYNQQQRQRRLRRLEQQAKALGYALISNASEPVAVASVS
jgi:transposase